MKQPPAKKAPVDKGSCARTDFTRNHELMLKYKRKRNEKEGEALEETIEEALEETQGVHDSFTASGLDLPGMQG